MVAQPPIREWVVIVIAVVDGIKQGLEGLGRGGWLGPFCSYTSNTVYIECIIHRSGGSRVGGLNCVRFECAGAGSVTPILTNPSLLGPLRYAEFAKKKKRSPPNPSPNHFMLRTP